MALSPWDPFREFDRMERFFRRTFEPRRSESFVSVAIELNDYGEYYLVRAEIPGVTEEAVDITLTGNVLSIRGEKSFEYSEGKAEEAEKEEKESSRPLYSEVYYGSFVRTLTLPDDIDAEKIDASYKNGVFFIEIGKKEQHRAKKITVTRH